jgi:Tol biopolymer transport system component
MRIRVATVCALAVAFGLVGVVVSSASENAARSGLIAFTRYRLQNSPLRSEIWVANPDGSDARRVSHDVQAAEDDQAHWSPDGRWIVFDRCTSDGPCSVWLVHPDGSGERKLAIACCDNSNPSFTPDGQHVVFQHEWGRVRHGSIPDNDQIEHSSIATVDLHGGSLTILRKLDDYRGGFEGPRISPNGKLLLYRAYRWNPAVQSPAALYVSPLHGAQARRITPWRFLAGGGEWSPDSTQILFKSSLVGGELLPGNALYTVRSDGTQLRRRSTIGGNHYVLTGSFSPDGRSIVFATDDGAVGLFADIFTQQLSSGRLVPVTRSRNLDGWPTWGGARS